MYCNQCDEAAKGFGCETKGLCGKPADVAALQDLLVHALKGVAFWAGGARLYSVADESVDRGVVDGLFSTVTNVDFSTDSVAAQVLAAVRLRDRARSAAENCGFLPAETEIPSAATDWRPGDTIAAMVAQGEEYASASRIQDEDLRSAADILLYGVKGYAAYAHHAGNLGVFSDEVHAFTHKALTTLLAIKTAEDAGEPVLLADAIPQALECGRINLVTMELLSEAHTGRFGHPEPTQVDTGARAGKAILVSGHDLRMLEALLEQTQDTGINVYTHGEMLPAHGYPGLKRFAHLAGNFGGAWQEQAREFVDFPGAIIFNTNCIQRPAQSYAERLFSWGLVSFPGVKHIDDWDFSEVMDVALASAGFPEDAPGRQLTVGFGHNAVLGVADKVIEAMGRGDLRHIFLVGGCDGSRPGRNYYTDLVEQTPDDTVVLTLACGKYRFNRMELGDIGGIPRLLDVGQCNDAYSAIKIALALAEATGSEVNDLPLSLVLSWYEQKAVAILLTLLHLGIKNMRLGPSLPAFVSPNIAGILSDGWGLKAITTAEADLAEILGAQAPAAAEEEAVTA